MVNAAADKYGIDRRMLTSQLFHESAYDSNAVSPAGAKGLGQFMDATAKEMGVDVKDPKSSIDGAARYFARMKNDFNKNDQLAYAAYNWGPGNVDSWLRTGKGMKGQPMPDETRNYVATITGRPLAPNMASAGNVPSASAAPMAAMIASNDGGFKPPPFGAAPKAGDMSPHGGPYIQRPEGIYATDRDGNVVGPVVKSITAPKFNKDKTEDKQPATKVVASPTKSIGPVGNDQGTPNLGGGVSQPMRDPDKIVPGATPSGGAGPKPEQDQPQQQAPASGANFNFNQNSDQMQKLWKYMLIKSLFPQLKFKNIGYDPWAVHKFGQGGGY
jgi:hypothetical protein